MSLGMQFRTGMATHLCKVHSHKDTEFLPAHQFAILKCELFSYHPWSICLPGKRIEGGTKTMERLWENAKYLLTDSNSYYMKFLLASLWLELSGVGMGKFRLYALWSVVIFKGEIDEVPINWYWCFGLKLKETSKVLREKTIDSKSET